jgi:hypothetical protein
MLTPNAWDIPGSTAATTKLSVPSANISQLFASCGRGAESLKKSSRYRSLATIRTAKSKFAEWGLMGWRRERCIPAGAKSAGSVGNMSAFF